MYEDPAAAKNKIMTRSSKIIGGFITETEFLKAYKNRFKDRPYSKGWWGGVENSAEKKLTFFVVKNVLSDLDRKVIRMLEKEGYAWKQLACENEQWRIKDDNDSYSIDQYVAMRGLIPKHDPNMIHPIVTGDARLGECIDFFEKEGLLQDIATSIDIEDGFLNVYYTISNIDLIGEEEDGTPVYIEIKFKNEFAKEGNDGVKRLVFGIDTFQYQYLFRAFDDCGMHVVNAILYNDIKDVRNINSTVIFDFLKAKNGEHMLWKYIRINMSASYETHQFAATHTSWYGERGRVVYCIPLKDYRDWGPYSLRDSYKDNFPEGHWGICSKCRKGYRIIRLSRNGEFMGCTNYKNHT